MDLFLAKVEPPAQVRQNLCYCKHMYDTVYLQFKFTQCAQIILSYVKILIAFHYSGNVMVLMIVEITVMKITATQVK